MAMADFLKALASAEDDAVHGVVGAFMTADAFAHQAFGKSPLFFDANRVRRITATLQTYFGVEPLGTAPQPVPEKQAPQGQQNNGQQGDNAAGAEKPQADLGGAGAGGGPAPATAQTFEQGFRETVGRIAEDVAAGGRGALELGEHGMHAIEEALGRAPATPAVEHPPATRIAGS